MTSIESWENPFSSPPFTGQKIKCTFQEFISDQEEAVIKKIKKERSEVQGRAHPWHIEFVNFCGRKSFLKILKSYGKY